MEYYYTETEDVEIVRLQGGQIVRVDELGKDNDERHAVIEKTAAKDENGEPITRTTKMPKIRWVTMSAVEILDQKDVPGRYIPIVEFRGDSTVKDGARYLSGAIRDAKDPQRQLNYFSSKKTETISLAPQAPWIMAVGQDEGFENLWKSANTGRWSVLYYKPTTTDGIMAPPPSRNVQEPPIQAMVMASSQMIEEIKATMQVFDASLGARGNETSGKAIESRKSQSGTANFTYASNFLRGLRVIGRILLDWIPVIYDTREIQRIIGDDDESQVVKLKMNPTDPAMTQEEVEGKIQKIYNPSVGQYDVIVDTGPNYLTKRREAFDLLARLTNSFPQLMGIAGDLIMRNSDIPGAQQIATRMKRALEKNSPELFDSSKDAIPPKARQAMEQMMQQIEQLSDALQNAVDEIESDRAEHDNKKEVEEIRTESQETIAMSQNIIEIIKVMMTEEGKATMGKDKAIVDRMKVAEDYLKSLNDRNKPKESTT